jgi:hypothetical protein
MNEERPQGKDNVRPRDPDHAQFSIDGITAAAVARFCDAIEFGIYDNDPSHTEMLELQRALTAIAREAHAAGMPVERMLIGLKSVWTKVCGRQPAPDMHDRCWDIVLKTSLDAYEATRPAG